MENRSYSGTFFINGDFKDGVYYPEEGKLEENRNPADPIMYLPAPVNAHTHIGDSIINEEPKGSLMEIVGPGGFKLRRLSETPEREIIKEMKETLNFIKRNMTSSLIDFREAGRDGINTIKLMNKEFPDSVVLARPKNQEDFADISNYIAGIGFSAISDDGFQHMEEMSKLAKKNKKLVATHFSENRMESLELLNEIKPDLLIHCTAVDRNLLGDLRKISRNLVITPRSNNFYNIKADYNSFLEEDFNLMIGTDNVMVTEPDIFAEMEFLFRYQKNVKYISPEKILEVACENPRRFFKENNVRNPDKWIKITGKKYSAFNLVTKFHMIENKFLVLF